MYHSDGTARQARCWTTGPPAHADAWQGGHDLVAGPTGRRIGGARDELLAPRQLCSEKAEETQKLHSAALGRIGGI